MAASRNKLPSDLLPRVADFVASHLAADEHLAVGLSGGCDSVVLLHLLTRLSLSERLQAVHVHHGLSPNADAWAEFCLNLCAQWAVPCVVQRVAVDPTTGLGLEAAARAARHAAFASAGAKNIFLAHHAGDQAETLLLNLLRGSGVSGLSGMLAERPISGMRFLRPLLAVSRAEIEAYARQQNLSWISDESNADRRFSRNFIRHEVLTAINSRFPAAEQALAQTAAHCAEADSLLGELAAIDWLQVADGEAANMRRLRQLPVLRLKNLLRHRLRLLAWRTPETSRLEEFARQLLTAAPDRHPRLDLPDGCLRVERGALHWLAHHKLLPVT